MDYSAASFWLTLVVAGLSAWNAYNSATLKLWATERFVSKSDFLNTLTLWASGDFKQKGHSDERHS